MVLIQFKRIILVIGVILFSVEARKCIPDAEAKSKIDQYVDGLVKCSNFTGASLAVVRNGKILLTKGYGLANVRREERVTTDTKFLTASITKSFTAQLISKLLTDKKYSIFYKQ